MKVGGFNAMREQYDIAAANYTFRDVSLYGNRTCGMPLDNSWHIFRPADDGSYPWPGMIFGLTILATNAWCTDQVIVPEEYALANEMRRCSKFTY